MNNQKTNTKIKNALLMIVGIPLAFIMASEIENPDYWWVQFVAAFIVFVIIKVAIGGKENEYGLYKHTCAQQYKRTRK